MYFHYFLTDFDNFEAKDFNLILLNHYCFHENRPHLETARQQYTTYYKYIC